jgi:hypothetical protein
MSQTLLYIWSTHLGGKIVNIVLTRAILESKINQNFWDFNNGDTSTKNKRKKKCGIIYLSLLHWSHALRSDQLQIFAYLFYWLKMIFGHV